jgi:hypothetical protein
MAFVHSVVASTAFLFSGHFQSFFRQRGQGDRSVIFNGGDLMATLFGMFLGETL